MPGYGNSTNTNKSTVKILTDEVDVDPFLDFQLYGETIIKIIKGSEPNYTIGIFGEWGTGKTTLMRYIFNELNKKNDDNESIIPVWFNAWKYEREHHFAIIPLLKTIELALPDEKYKNLRDSLREAGLFGLRVSKNFISSMIGSYLGTVTGDIVKKGITDFTEKILPGLKEIDEIEKRTIYFEGQSKIENEIKNIRMKDPSLRIVVFVDDLDRCSPEKVIEVFESIKVFLGMDGFIYVLGISHNKISQLIKEKYKFELEQDGEQYIKKIIQIPIMIPEWNIVDLGNLIENVISKKLDNKYSEIVRYNKDSISRAVELSPREIKRFINSFIISHEIFSVREDIKPTELLVVQTLRLRWNKFYKFLSTDPIFRKLIQDIINFSDDFRNAVSSPEHSPEQIDKEIKRIDEELSKLKREQLQTDEIINFKEKKEQERDKLKEYNYNKIPLLFKKILQEAEDELWVYLKQENAIVFGIDWEIYRRAVELVKDPITEEKSVEKTRTNIQGSTAFGKFNYPKGIAVDSSGFVYVSDTGNHRIQKFDSNGKFIGVWGEFGKDNGQFDEPRGIAVDSSGFVYVSDGGNNRIHKFDSNGKFIALWGGIPFDNVHFYYPTGIAVDLSNFVYVADSGRQSIQKLDRNGTLILKWGKGGTSPGEFDYPRDIAVDSSGFVYIVDTNNHRIQKFDNNGNFITVI